MNNKSQNGPLLVGMLPVTYKDFAPQGSHWGRGSSRGVLARYALDSQRQGTHRGPECAGQLPQWCNLDTGRSAAAQSGHRTQGSVEVACKWQVTVTY